MGLNNKRIEYIDFAKGFAILSIVVFHYCQPYTTGLMQKAVLLGGAGVHLFFVLSGFGLGLSSKQMSLPLFYKKRFVKILVPYYFVVLVIFLINLVYPLYPRHQLYALGGHLFFYKMFDETIIGSFGYHLWFISTIIQFYLLFPLISFWQRKSTIKNFLIGSLLISLCYWIFLAVYELYDQRIFNSFFLQYLWEFNLGIVLAKLYIFKGKEFWNQNTKFLFITSMISFLFMAIIILLFGDVSKVLNDLFSCFGFLSFSAFLYSISKNKLKIIKKSLLFIGTISYELYLVHMLVFGLTNSFLNKVLFVNSHIVYSFILILPLSVLVSILFTRLTKLFYQNPLVSKLI